MALWSVVHLYKPILGQDRYYFIADISARTYSSVAMVLCCVISNPGIEQFYTEH